MIQNLKNEYVSIGGHYDHEGIKNGEIYNGADDNGSGVVGVLETSRKLIEANNNKRSILIMFYTAEEKGLMGARYLSNNVEYINDIVVNVNLDMIGRMSADTLHSVGANRLSEELHNIKIESNKKTVNFVFDYQFDDPKDPQNIYNRSDHINFARKGIPVVFFTENMKEDYHKPTDTGRKN